MRNFAEVKLSTRIDGAKPDGDQDFIAACSADSGRRPEAAASAANSATDNSAQRVLHELASRWEPAVRYRHVRATDECGNFGGV